MPEISKLLDLYLTVLTDNLSDSSCHESGSAAVGCSSRAAMASSPSFPVGYRPPSGLVGPTWAAAAFIFHFSGATIYGNSFFPLWYSYDSSLWGQNYHSLVTPTAYYERTGGVTRVAALFVDFGRCILTYLGLFSGYWNRVLEGLRSQGPSRAAIVLRISGFVNRDHTRPYHRLCPPLAAFFNVFSPYCTSTNSK